MSLNDPYVHSNIYNFHSQIAGSFLDITSTQGEERLNRQIAEIQHLRNQLKSAADDFLGGLTPQQASNQLLNNPRTYSKIALEILRSEKMRQSLIVGNQYNAQSVQSFFNNDKLKNRILEIVNDNDLQTIAIDALVDEIIESMGGYQIFLNLSGVQQRQELGKIFTGKAAERRIQEKMRKKARSETGKIKKVIIELINESRLRTTKSNSLDQSFAYFSRTFLNNIKEEKIVYQNGQTPQDYLNLIHQNIIGLKDYQDKSNAAGALGEEWLRAVIISDTATGFNIEVVGGETEENGTILKDLEKMVTHHKMSAQSQTDLIITNSINQKKVRVQAKNYMDVLNKMIDVDENIPLLAKIQEETNFLRLLERLRGTAGGVSLSDNELSGIAYLVANELWFNMKGSYGEGEGRRLSSNAGGLSYAIQQINNLITSALVNFIGITIDENLTIHNEASNIFFLFSNSVLIPCYMLLDGIIAQLKNYETQIASLKVTLKRNGINWAYNNVEKFYNAKKEAVGKLDPARHYQDEALLNVGKAQGQNIMSSLNISRINLKIDLHTLLTSAWNF